MKYAALYAILFLVSVGLAALVLIHYQHARNLRRQNRGPQDRHAAAKPIALAAAEVQIDVERGTTPRVEAQKIPENVGQTRGPNVWEHDGDAQQAYGLPACPQCLTVREAYTPETLACSTTRCTYLAIEGLVAELEEAATQTTPTGGATPPAHFFPAAPEEV